MILRVPRKGLGVAAAAVFLLCGLCQLATAAGSWLAVRQTNGHDWLYIINEIERITYDGDQLDVITVDGVDTYALDAIIRIDFIPDTTTVGVDGPGNRPVSIDPSHLFQNSPNPFSPETRIAFDLPTAGRAELRIYDVRGRLVRTLIDGKRAAGPQSVSWDGRDETGVEVASGVYFYSLNAPGVDESRRMILVR
jgi:hypothetical protein